MGINHKIRKEDGKFKIKRGNEDECDWEEFVTKFEDKQRENFSTEISSIDEFLKEFLSKIIAYLEKEHHNTNAYILKLQCQSEESISCPMSKGKNIKVYNLSGEPYEIKELRNFVFIKFYTTNENNIRPLVVGVTASKLVSFTSGPDCESWFSKCFTNSSGPARLYLTQKDLDWYEEKVIIIPVESACSEDPKPCVSANAANESKCVIKKGRNISTPCRTMALEIESELMKEYFLVGS